MIELRNARLLGRSLMEGRLEEGDVAVDATMGNGHDTLYLAQQVGDSGLVHAFDVQTQAIESTRARLNEAGLEKRVRLHALSHEKMDEVVKGPVRLIVFNLGWLPGGDHSITTQTGSTLAAVQKGLNLLSVGGLMVICAYPGHSEGQKEKDCLEDMLQGLEPRFNVLRGTFLNHAPGAPQVFAVQRDG